jgi:hypothetical protein
MGQSLQKQIPKKRLPAGARPMLQQAGLPAGAKALPSSGIVRFSGKTG